MMRSVGRLISWAQASSVTTLTGASKATLRGCPIKVVQVSPWIIPSNICNFKLKLFYKVGFRISINELLLTMIYPIYYLGF